MSEYIDQATEIIKQMPVWLIVLSCILVFVGIVGQWALYEKCNLPGYSCLVPIWNIIIFLKIVGRPAKHSITVAIPPVLIGLALFLFWDNLVVGASIAGVIFLPWAYFMIKVYIELCKCFGKNDIASYILIVVFNGFYLFNLALNEEEKYHGPIYKAGMPEPSFI